MPPRPASRPGPPPRPSALAAPVCPCCTRLLLLLPASQGSTGDPRLLSWRKAIASQAPPSRGWHVASCRPVPPRAFAIHQNGPLGGRLLPHLGNLPGKGSFFRKVRRFSGGPSMLEAVFPEGPAFFRGIFHARGRFSGRSGAFQGDLPCQGPFSRKVRRFSGGPSMPGAVFPEGPALFRGTFHASARFPGRSCVFPGDLPCQGPFSRKVGVVSGGPSGIEVIFPEGPRTGWRTGRRKGLHCGRDPFLMIWHGNIGKKIDLAVWHRQKEYNPAGGRWQKVCDSGRD